MLLQVQHENQHLIFIITKCVLKINTRVFLEMLVKIND
jgi:hypothetical protein